MADRTTSSLPRTCIATCVAAAFLAIDSARAQTAVADTVTCGNLSIALSRDAGRVVDGMRSTVKCNSTTTQLKLTYDDDVALEADEVTLKALLSEAGIPSDGASSSRPTPLGLRDALVARSTTLASPKLIQRDTETVSVAPERCFNKVLIQRYRKHHYAGKPTWLTGSWRRPDVKEFNWDETVEAEYVIEAHYDETCASDCVIRGKQREVEGKDGKPVWARVRLKGSTAYFVPLFYDPSERIIDIVPLLPHKIAFGADGEVSVSYASR